MASGLSRGWEVAIALMLILATAFVASIFNSCNNTSAVDNVRKELGDKIDKIGDRINDPQTGLAVLHERLKNHIESHNQLKKTFRKMCDTASLAEKAILIRDASLYMLDPETFLEIHIKNMPWLKQYAGDIKNLDYQMQRFEFTPPK